MQTAVAGAAVAIGRGRVLVLRGELETLTRLAEIGGASFLQKPFRPDELISRVCQMLPK
jgi:DNA-binding response OmpR family regulator